MTPTFEAARDEAADKYLDDVSIDNGTAEGQGLSHQQKLCALYGYREGANWSRKWTLEHDSVVRGLVEAAEMVCKYPDSEGCLDELHEALAAWNKARGEK